MKKTIYLIEDDETIVTIVKKHLENWDYHVASPQNFQGILEEFQILTPDLILLDISLPYFNCGIICYFRNIFALYWRKYYVTEIYYRPRSFVAFRE